MAKKPVQINNLSYEDAVKMIKSIKGFSRSIVGEDEIKELCSVKRLRTGIPTLDFMGSFTDGRMNILAGNPSACKSTIIQQVIPKIIDEIEESGETKFILYFDVEGSYDENYASNLGIKNKYMIIKRTKVIEDAFSECAALVEAGFIKAVIFDSLDAMMARKQDDNQFDNTMGSQAGALAMHLPSLYTKLLEHNVTSFIVKQARVKFGAMGHGEVITFSGGKALRHFADNIFILKRKSNFNLTYTPISIKAEKTRSPRMGITLEVPLGECGIDKVRDLVQISTSVGLIETAGAGWMTLNLGNGETLKLQGQDKAIAYLKEHTEVYESLYAEFYAKYVDNALVKVASTEEFAVDLGED